ncbi:MAG TPA: HAD family phosphatase [Candidatus Acidoferrales bacterium]|nr:HAD family phosphatase [Candidatus Acidoferrales bacterium]
MIQAVIFDMDGLIVDTEILESRALEQIVKEFGKKPQLNDNGLIHQIGGAGKTYYTNLISKYQLPLDPDTLKAKKRIIFEQLVKNGGLKPFDGFFELLDIIKKSKLKLALASNRYIGHIHLILDELRVKEYFDVIVGPSEMRKHKPHPDIYLHTAKQLGVEPENCLALEDTHTGILSAHTAGMKIIAVPNEYTKEHDFSHADMVVKSLKSVTIELINTL